MLDPGTTKGEGGIARIDPDAPPSDEVPSYQEKYAGYISPNGWTPESFATDYPITVGGTPKRSRV